ncbi:MAG: winged helix-turn-helix transcriptional regulator [Dysgonamonadaceae bacterium]|jgi:fido (protein-threonine AMPylation protein)|nr:winged helix-turn-helix transcriptional regulator [Dysgonamonadaceae bacterium]
MIDDFEEYIRQGEPSQKEKSQIWQTAIGLQQVDGLTPSAYLIETAKENIEGKITIDEVKYRIDNYYKQQVSKKTVEGDRTEEADKVSANITEILSEKTFTFSPAELLSIHKRLFTGVENITVKVGKVRDYNITKNEWVLDGKTVYYASADTINATLDYDFKQEKNFNYKGLSKREIVEHIANFISGLWQIHALGEGNTRTIAVFTIKYLRTFGFEVENDLFAKHSWYFRNALVRANYNDYQHKIYATPEYLMLFFGNLLLGEKNELKNRFLRIDTNNEIVEKQNVVLDDSNGGQKGDEGGRKKWSEKVVRLLDLIVEKPNITRKELSEALSINPSAVQKHLEKLKKEGVISREGSDKKGFWKVIKR